MSKKTKIKEQSPLVQSVTALDGHFSELERLSLRIAEIELKSDSDCEVAQRLMNHFTEHGQAISTAVVNFATCLNEAKAQAEEAAKVVASRAAQLQARRADQDQKMEVFRQLDAKVGLLGREMGALKKPEGEVLSEEERANLSRRLAELDIQLQPLIEEALDLKKQAQDSKMKSLMQNADSLSQSLQAVSQKLSAFHPNQVEQLMH